MADDSTCKIDTGTVNITGRDGTVRTVKTVWYVLEARSNLISKRVLDSKGCQI